MDSDYAHAARRGGVRAFVRLATPLALTLVFACSERALRPINPCTTLGAQQRVAVRDLADVDLVFMIDDSGSMREEQQKLRRQLPQMIRGLATGLKRGGVLSHC